jgi:hypothetical protein
MPERNHESEQKRWRIPRAMYKKLSVECLEFLRHDLAYKCHKATHTPEWLKEVLSSEKHCLDSFKSNLVYFPSVLFP